jgi:hypothetical protein
MTGAGGIVAGGTADFVFQLVAQTLEYTPTGGIVAGGHADVAVGIDYVPTGGLVSGGFAYAGTPYDFDFEVGGPGFVLHDIVLAQRADYDKDAARLQIYRVVGEVVRIDLEGEATVAVTEGEEFLDEFGDGIEFVRVGNTTNPTRRGSIYLTSDDSFAPFLDVIDGVNSIAKLGTISTIKARVGNLAGIVDSDFGQLSGYGLYSQNAYLKGDMVLGPNSSISWANIPDHPDVPVQPAYIQSTYIDAVQIRSPNIIGVTGSLGDAGNAGVLKSYGKTAYADGNAGFWLEGLAGGAVRFELYYDANNYYRFYNGSSQFYGDVYVGRSGSEYAWLYRFGTSPIQLVFVAGAGANAGWGAHYVGNGGTYEGYHVLESSRGLVVLSDMNVIGAIKVNGTQVVGGQSGAITDAGGTLAQATSAINAALAALRSHGLIAT